MPDPRKQQLVLRIAPDASRARPRAATPNNAQLPQRVGYASPEGEWSELEQQGLPAGGLPIEPTGEGADYNLRALHQLFGGQHPDVFQANYRPFHMQPPVDTTAMKDILVDDDPRSWYNQHRTTLAGDPPRAFDPVIEAYKQRRDAALADTLRLARLGILPAK